MSLENSETYTQIDERNPLDTSNSVNILSSSIFAQRVEDFYSPDASVEMYTLKFPVDSQRSSQNFPVPEYDRQETDSKLTTIEKHTKNHYKILIESVQDNNTLTPSPDNFRLGIPQTQFRTSTIYTSLSSDSSQMIGEQSSPQKIDEKKENFKNEVQKSKVRIGSVSRPAASIRNSTFALTNRIFCVKCGVETYTEVSFQMKEMNFWGSIGFFLTAIKCCGEPRALSRYQDIVHSCKKCGSVVAKISTV